MPESVFAAQTNPSQTIMFSDMEADVLAREASIQREARAALIGGSAWGEFLRKVLAPGVAQPTMRVLRTSQA